jgi:hypothetical protein
MNMLAGNTVTQSAKALEAHFSKGEGFWIAQWPEMNVLCG